MQQAKGDWVLFIDSDEVVSEDLKNEILSLSQKTTTVRNCDGYYLKRKDYFMGKWLKYGETAHIKHLRLARKDRGKWERLVHETWKINGRLGLLNHPILHYPHPTIKEFLKEINFYSSLHAEVAHKEGKRTNYLLILLKPKLKFLKNYFYYFGFLDGIQGLIVALMMSFHSFLTQCKLWQLQQSKVNSI